MGSGGFRLGILLLVGGDVLARVRLQSWGSWMLKVQFGLV